MNQRSGCDANDGGDHYPIAEGRYIFCGNCGETLRGKQHRKVAVPLSEAMTDWRLAKPGEVSS